MVFALMPRVAAVELGSILITKLPPGEMIEPHSDAGTGRRNFTTARRTSRWPGQRMVRCDERCGDSTPARSGRSTIFCTHSIENIGDCDRIVCIVSMRCGMKRAANQPARGADDLRGHLLQGVHRAPMPARCFRSTLTNLATSDRVTCAARCGSGADDDCSATSPRPALITIPAHAMHSFLTLTDDD